MEGKTMLIQKAFRYELRPDGAAIRSFSRCAGIRRFVWNKALAQPKYLGFTANCKQLPLWKIEFPWMREANAQVLQQTLKDLDQGFKNFFAGRAKRPTFKKKFKSEDSFRFPQDFKIEEDNDRLYLPKIGWLRYRNSRPLRGKAKNVTVSRHGKKWFASIQTEFEVADPVHPSTSQVGIDLGVVRFATASDGSFIEALNALKKKAARLRRYQRRMSRKVKFSKNWKKAQARVAKLHEDVANSRKDFLHKLTTEQAKNHSLICIEDLKVGSISRSAAGTIAEPGRKVKQKSGLNKSILDQGWSEYRRQLEYKAKWSGGQVIAVTAMNTSRRCPCCDHVSKDNRKTQADFVCVECGFAANADHVGALNILAAGLAVYACGGVLEVRGPVKQEPTERAA